MFLVVTRPRRAGRPGPWSGRRLGPLRPAGRFPDRRAVGSKTGRPAALVDPEVGTGVGPVTPGNVSEYPGASAPLGMVQFSPDTSPDRQVTTGSGYDYADSEISGFSLTHLSGPGCAIYGDVPILPVEGALPATRQRHPTLLACRRARVGRELWRAGRTGPTRPSASGSPPPPVPPSASSPSPRPRRRRRPGRPDDRRRPPVQGQRFGRRLQRIRGAGGGRRRAQPDR